MGDKGKGGFADRWEQLAIDETVNISVDATITPQTRVAPSPKMSAPGAPPRETLPQISLHRSDQGTPTAELRAKNPDIVLGELIGSGGMGQVWLAQQRSLGREIAVKLLNPDADPSMAEALASEAVLAAFLAHPGIVPVHALGVDESGRPVLVMKRIEGVSWLDLLSDDGHPAWQQWQSRAGDRLLAHLEILSQVCDAVHFAHSKGVIHRDLKPENVMLGSFGEVYLVDWGLAVRVTDQPLGALAGTPAYMAPEMVEGAPVDERTDVYLLGATLHHVLTGEHRHRGDELRAVLESVFASAPVRYPSEVPNELATLCNSATALDPADRPASALAVRGAIADYLRHRSSIALSTAARARLEELSALIGGAEAEKLTLEAHSLAAEAHFGFSQALDAWAGNKEARRGLQDCRVAQVEIHLTRRDAAAARAVFGQLDHGPDELGRRIRKLELADEAERQERERLEALDREMDGSVGKQARLVAYVIMVALALGIAAFMHLRKGGLSSLTHKQAFGFSVLVLVSLLIGICVKRKQLFATAFNRRGVGLVLMAIILVVGNRSIAWALGIPLRFVLSTDALVLAMACGAAALMLMRWCGWMALIFVATAISIAVFPSVEPPLTFSSGAIAAALTAVGFWRRTG